VTFATFKCQRLWKAIFCSSEPFVKKERVFHNRTKAFLVKDVEQDWSMKVQTWTLLILFFLQEETEQKQSSWHFTRRTRNKKLTQFMIHERLKGLGLTIHNHIIHGNCNKNPTKKCIRKRKSSRHKSMTKCALSRANNKTMILVNGAKLLAIS